MSRTPNPPLLPSLLEAHHCGRPPFLVRTLRYVHDDKQRSKSRVWDITWAQTNLHKRRHIVLTIRPTQCIIQPSVLKQMRQTHVRISLRVKQTDGHFISFGMRDVPIRVWNAQTTTPDDSFEDVPIAESFDLSAVLPLLATAPAALIVCLDIWLQDTVARGEIIVWDGVNGKFGAAVPNAVVQVKLWGDRQGRKVAKPVNLAEEVDKQMKGMQDKQDQDIGNMESVGSVKVELHGGVQKAIDEVMNQNPQRVHVTCSYSSPKVPSWNGIVRHDFICPWCHRNCHRFRTLLSHFQVEHENMKLSLEGSVPTKNVASSTNDHIPFLIKFEVTPESIPERRTGSNRISRNMEALNRSSNSELPIENLYIERGRFGTAKSLSVRKRSDEEVREALNKVSINTDDDDDVEEEQIDTDTDSETTGREDGRRRREKQFLSIIKQELFGVCKNCARKHNRSYAQNVKFCGEWCEAMYKDKMDQGDDFKRSTSSAIVTKPKEKKIDFKKAFGHLKLYHVVSVSEVKEGHFDEDDPDSEEEVDQSWRLDLSLERIRHLEDATAKEKILWMMWNQFAHDQYPIPSVYGERYTRYTLELFALEYGAQVARLKLRLQFVGFLRALHVHGLIDTNAIKSIMLCLDGKKKLRQCKISSKPDLPEDFHNRTARNTGAGRGRKGRRRN